MTRRVESSRIEAGRLETSARGLWQAEASSGSAVERGRLNAIGKGAKNKSGAAVAFSLDHLDTSELERAEISARRSLDDLIIEFVMPHVPGPTVLRQSVSILQNCITELVPGLEGGEQLKSLARALMEDEIERHRELLGRLQRGIEI